MTGKGNAGVFRSERDPGTPDAAGAMQYLAASVGRIPYCEMGLVVLVGDEECEAGVLFDEGNIPSGKIDGVKVMKAWVTSVQGDEDAIANCSADPADSSGNAIERCQVPGEARCRIDSVDMEVLVAVPILDIDQMAAVIGPTMHPYAAAAIVGDGLRLVRSSDRGDPDIEHTGRRRQPREEAPIRTDLGGGLARVAEQVGTGNQGRNHLFEFSRTDPAV